MLLSCSNIFGQSNKADDRIVSINEFRSFIDTIGLVFDMPQGFKPTIVKENGDLSYYFAIINIKNSLKLEQSQEIMNFLYQLKKCTLIVDSKSREK